MTKRNPKQEGSNIFDCKPQTGLCPNNCNQCFYNRPGAFYVDPYLSHMPDVDEIGDGIVRVNSGHDSNVQRDLVISSTEQYKNRFFNTSMPEFDFPGPVVFTANPKEEERVQLVEAPNNLMFVRLRVSATNLEYIDEAIEWYAAEKHVPVVLTFMAYYSDPPKVAENLGLTVEDCYIWKQRHINSYWCPTYKFMKFVMDGYCSNLVTMCGNLNSNACVDCRNCETYYWQTIKRMNMK